MSSEKCIAVAVEQRRVTDDDADDDNDSGLLRSKIVLMVQTIYSINTGRKRKAGNKCTEHVNSGERRQLQMHVWIVSIYRKFLVQLG